MKIDEEATISSIGWTFTILCLIVVFIYNWNRRWIHYYGWKIPGPLALPIIGSMHILLFGDDVLQIFMNAAGRYPSIFKLFMGLDLCVFTSQPEDVEIITNNFLEKGKSYAFLTESFKASLLAVNAKTWKINRGYINYSFSSQILNSFESSFAKNAKILVKNLGELCENEQEDLIPVIWRTTLDISFETLLGIDPHLIKERYDVNFYAERIEYLAVHRMKTFWLYPTIFWRISFAGREHSDISKRTRTLAKHIISVKESLMKKNNVNSTELQFMEKSFLNYQIKLKNEGILTSNQIEEEGMFFAVSSSETGAITINSVLLVLGLYPEIQEKIFHEVSQILGNNGDITYKDINQMDYLERVIKETMRLLPLAPILIRNVDKDFQLGSYTVPTGSQVFILVSLLHRRPDIWKDPLKFDPDRFLPEEIKKRPRNCFIPFSYGPRNCIGLKYAMLSVKMILAHILKEYTIKATNYKSIKDIHLDFYVLSRPKKGYKISLERRS